MKKKSEKSWKKECLELWRIAINLLFNKKCFVCGGNKCLNAHHIFSKGGHQSVRFDIDNGVLLCYYHHRQAHEANPEVILKILSKFKDNEYETLRTKAKSGALKHDYEAIREFLNATIERYTKKCKELQQ